MPEAHLIIVAMRTFGDGESEATARRLMHITVTSGRWPFWILIELPVWPLSTPSFHCALGHPWTGAAGHTQRATGQIPNYLYASQVLWAQINDVDRARVLANVDAQQSLPGGIHRILQSP